MKHYSKFVEMFVCRPLYAHYTFMPFSLCALWQPKNDSTITGKGVSITGKGVYVCVVTRWCMSVSMCVYKEHFVFFA